MEDAYRELYQEFLRLRSLCLRQAALLHQLTKALQKQQGATIPNGESNDSSIPVQCARETPVCFQGNPVTAHKPAAQPGTDGLSGNVGTFSDFLAQDMSKLCMAVPHQREDAGKAEEKSSRLLALDSPNPRLTGDPGGSRMKVFATDSQTQEGALMSQCGGLLMSDVALQSHVCDFCQAVFPGDTTTRGEFLRHLDTHIS